MLGRLIDQVKTYFDAELKKAPPSTRKIDEGWVLLGRHDKHYELCLISQLPKTGIPEKGKIYLEAKGTHLNYMVKAPDNSVVLDTLDINLDGLSEKTLESLVYYETNEYDSKVAERSKQDLNDLREKILLSLLGRGHIRRTTGAHHFVGAFSADLYEMAQAKELGWKADDPRRYRADGSPKSSVGLAIVPYKNKQEIENFIASAMYDPVTKEQKTLPATVFKGRITKEYLARILAEQKLELYVDPKYPNRPAIDDHKMNLNNWKHTTRREQVFHYVGQWLSYAFGAIAAVEIALLTGLTFPAVMLPLVAGVAVSKYSKDFMLFDVNEYSLRDLGWMLRKDYAWKGKWNWANALKTSGYLAGIGLAMYQAIVGVWASTLTLPLWSTAVSMGAPVWLASAAAVTMAGASALIAGAGTWIGLSNAVRYFDTFTVFEKNIDPAAVNEWDMPVIVKTQEEADKLHTEYGLAVRVVPSRRHQDQRNIDLARERDQLNAKRESLIKELDTKVKDNEYLRTQNGELKTQTMEQAKQMEVLRSQVVELEALRSQAAQMEANCHALKAAQEQPSPYAEWFSGSAAELVRLGAQRTAAPSTSPAAEPDQKDHSPKRSSSPVH